MSEKLTDRFSHITLFGLLRETSQWCVFWKQHRLIPVPDNIGFVDRNLSILSQLPNQLPELQATTDQERNKDKDLKTNISSIAFSLLPTSGETWLLLSLHSPQVLLLPLLISHVFLSLTLFALHHENPTSDAKRLHSLLFCAGIQKKRIS